MCKYCEDGEIMFYSDCGWGFYINFMKRLSTTKESECGEYDDGFEGGKINYCPMCGKKL